MLKSRDITLPTKVCIVKALVFSVVTYECESWTIKKTECLRMGVFKLWCWRRLLRVPWTTRRSSQSILNEINSEYSLEGLMLKLQYLSHLMRRADSLEKTLMLKKTTQKEKRVAEDEMIRYHHWLNAHESEPTSGDSERQGKPGVLQSTGSQRVEHNLVTEQWQCVFRPP